MLFELSFAAVSIILVLAIALSLRVQRIRLMKMSMQVRHDMARLEKSVDEFRKALPDLVDREKLAVEKEHLRREISAVDSRLGKEEKTFAKLSKEIESDKRTDRMLMRNIQKLQKMLDKVRARLAPKKKLKKPVKKAKKK